MNIEAKTFDDELAYYEICEEILLSEKKAKLENEKTDIKKNSVAVTKIKQIFEDYKNIGKKTESAMDIYAETYNRLLKLNSNNDILKAYKKLALNTNLDNLRDVSNNFVQKYEPKL